MLRKKELYVKETDHKFSDRPPRPRAVWPTLWRKLEVAQDYPDPTPPSVTERL